MVASLYIFDPINQAVIKKYLCGIPYSSVVCVWVITDQLNNPLDTNYRWFRKFSYPIVSAVSIGEFEDS